MDGETLNKVYRMSASELWLWHQIGGDIPAGHPQLFLLRDRLRKLAAMNGTKPAEPPITHPAALTAKRRAIG